MMLSGARRERRRTLTVVAAVPQKALALIVARELAANLATPMFLIDAAGDLVFYNEAAEQIIGKPFAELGTISSIEWGEMLHLAQPDGAPLRRRDSPPGIAFMQRRPAHSTLRATAFDGVDRVLEVTAYPLFAKADEMHGVVAIFWEIEGA
jgi:PAS domain-containing protein